MDYLRCESDSMILEWAYSLPFDVAYIWLDQFSDDAAAAWSDSLDYLEVFNIYKDKIRLIEENNHYFSYVKYPLFPYFIGAEGYFKINGGIIAEEGDYIISIPDGSLTKLATARQTLETDTLEEIYVFLTTEQNEQLSFSCCPFRDISRVYHVNPNNGHQSHRLTNVVDGRILKIVSYLNENFRRTTYQFAITAEMNHHKRGFAAFWYTQKRDATFNFDFEITHPCSSQHSNPYVISISRGVKNDSKHKYEDGICLWEINHNKFLNILPPYNHSEFCINSFNLTTVTIGNPVISNILSCGQ